MKFAQRFVSLLSRLRERIEEREQAWWFHYQEWLLAMLIEVGAIRVPVASIEHLIAMKTGTGRSKDLINIEELRKIQAQK